MGQNIKAKAEKDREEQLQSLKAQIAAYKMKNECEKAGTLLKNLADELNTWESMAEYAKFCSGLYNTEEAEQYYLMALSLIQTNKNKDDLYCADIEASILNNLAIIYHMTRRMKESERYFLDALAIRRRLAAIDNQAYEASLADLLSSFSSLYLFLDRYSEAEALQLEALEIHRRLSTKDPESYRPSLAMTMVNMGSVYSRTERFKESAEMYAEALEVYRQLAVETPKKYDQDIAYTLKNYGEICTVTYEFPKGETLFLESIGIYRKLVEENPINTECELAEALEGLGKLYYYIQRFEECDSLLLEALSIRKKLFEYNPDYYIGDIHSSIEDLTVVYSNTMRYTKLEMLLDDMLAFVYSLERVKPIPVVKYEIAILSYQLFEYYSQIGQNDKCVLMYQESSKYLRELAIIDIETYGTVLAAVINNYADYLCDLKKFTESEALYLEVLRIYKAMNETGIQSYDKIAQTLNNLAIQYRQTQCYSESEKMYLEAIDINRELVKIDPPKYEIDLAKTLSNYAVLLHDRTEYASAIAAKKEALTLLWKIRLNKDANMSSDEIEINNMYFFNNIDYIAIYYPQIKEYADCYEFNEEWIPILRDICKNDSRIAESVLVDVLGTQSLMCIYFKRFQESEQYATEALTLDPLKKSVFSCLSASYLFQGKYVEAEEIYRAFKNDLKDIFLQDLQDFEAAGVIPRKRKADVEKIKKMLNE